MDMRHPASLTKVMTLYVLFQDLKAERIKLTERPKSVAAGGVHAAFKTGVEARLHDLG